MIRARKIEIKLHNCFLHTLVRVAGLVSWLSEFEGVSRTLFQNWNWGRFSSCDLRKPLHEVLPPVLTLPVSGAEVMELEYRFRIQDEFFKR